MKAAKPFKRLKIHPFTPHACHILKAFTNICPTRFGQKIHNLNYIRQKWSYKKGGITNNLNLGLV